MPGPSATLAPTVRALCAFDSQLRLPFARLFQTLVQGDVDGAISELMSLEAMTEDVVRDLEGQGQAVAAANARAVEVAERLQALASRLERQNQELRQQNLTIEGSQRELEAQAQAIAAANVEAVLEAEAVSRRITEIEKSRADLERRGRELERQTQELSDAADALASANAEAVAMVIEKDQALAKLTRNTKRIRRQRKELEAKVFKDELTGLFNTRFFRQQLALEFARARRYGHPLSLVFVDLDHFKEVNDNFGHVVGDCVLRRVAELIGSQLRFPDLPARLAGEPCPARYGGEELVVILPETDRAQALCIAERIRAAVEAEEILGPEGDGHVKVTLSGGVTAMLPEDADAEELIRRADAALYVAKSCGRNRVEVG